MIDLFIGSLVLSLIHAAIPNHWIPVVMIGKAEKWNRKEIIGVAAITSFAHTLSTVVLGVIIGMVGFKLSNTYEMITGVVAPLILVGMGIIYFSLSLRHAAHDHFPDQKKLLHKSKTAIIVSLSAAMFFSPCLEIESYYFMAGTHGWQGILLLSLIYLTVTVLGSILLVALAQKSLEQFQWHFMEKHEKKITGTILIALGLLTFFIKH